MLGLTKKLKEQNEILSNNGFKNDITNQRPGNGKPLTREYRKLAKNDPGKPK